MKIRILIRIVFLSALLFCGSFYFLKNVEYEPKDAILVSDRFLELLIVKKLEEAFTLTNENAIVGTSFERFQKKVGKELGNGDLTACDLSVTGHYPKQSYGNRIRRYWNQNGVEVDPFNVEYDPCGIPFRISLRFNRNGEWKVVNFQSHAE
ncbi:sugar:proton symporter [Leptospira sp. 201903071]|uniref:sugar:proton symporter n=1 Tax=Leptospira ainazelensis TaxID=2810034 RepID=UPI0019666F66|nr:sugar:proton symporter [Leptospira ainazelensis]MBM9502294.1 sugar:proton symporter [Leptospira ainazelensis]